MVVGVEFINCQQDKYISKFARQTTSSFKKILITKTQKVET